MRYIRATVPSVPVATVHAWSDAENGDGIGTPYMFLDWIEGKTLEWNVNIPSPAARGNILAQLSRYTADLLARTPLQSTPQSTLEWMLRRIDTRFIRILTGDLCVFDPIDCLIQRAMAEEKYLVSCLDNLPFPLMHTDLSRLNIIVDDDFNITGYVIFVLLADIMH
jgi:aminoglycoside phosphotransferase (APT) family kinase protein